MAEDYVEHALGPMPPTGRSFSSRSSHWFRVADGRLAEHWATRDDLTSMIQMGVIVRQEGRLASLVGQRIETHRRVGHQRLVMVPAADTTRTHPFPRSAK
jgi:hypothetical protein